MESPERNLLLAQFKESDNTHSIASLIYALLADQDKKIDNLIQAHHETRDAHKETQRKLQEHLDEETTMFTKFKEAFPDGDTRGHREYHETLMKEMERRVRFRDAIIEKSLAGLVWSGLVAMGAAIWTYVKDHMK